MYGMEHGFLMHGLMVACTWLVFVVLCLLPLVLLYGVYRLGLKRGQRQAVEANRSRSRTGARPQ